MDNCKRFTLPVIISLIGVLMLISSVFLPYISATGELKEILDVSDDAVEVLKELGISNGEADSNEMEWLADITHSEIEFFRNISLYNFCRLCYHLMPAFGYIMFAYLGFIFLLSLLDLIAVIRRRPIRMLIFTVPILYSAISSVDVLNKSKDVIHNIDSMYTWGVGYFFELIGSVLIAVCAIWVFVENQMRKKSARQNTITNNNDNQ